MKYSSNYFLKSNFDPLYFQNNQLKKQVLCWINWSYGLVYSILFIFEAIQTLSDIVYSYGQVPYLKFKRSGLYEMFPKPVL